MKALRFHVLCWFGVIALVGFAAGGPIADANPDSLFADIWAVLMGIVVLLFGGVVFEMIRREMK